MARMPGEAAHGLLFANDPVLVPLLEARDEESVRREIGALIVSRAAPIIDRVLDRQFGGEWLLGEHDADEIRAVVNLRLVARLREAAESERRPIRQFDDLVSILANNVAYDALRVRFPERARLKARVRYILSKDDRERAEEQMVVRKGLASGDKLRDLFGVENAKSGGRLRSGGKDPAAAGRTLDLPEVRRAALQRAIDPPMRRRQPWVSSRLAVSRIEPDD